MDKKVLISVKTIQYSGDEPEAIELVTEGKYCKNSNGYTATYDESEISGMEGTITTLETQGNSFSILRKGTTNSDLIFTEGKEHISLYSTPFGSLEVIVNPSKVSINLDDNGGTVELNYKMKAAGLDLTDNQLELKIKDLN